jgi:hypothetical protein
MEITFTEMLTTCNSFPKTRHSGAFEPPPFEFVKHRRAQCRYDTGRDFFTIEHAHSEVWQDLVEVAYRALAKLSLVRFSRRCSGLALDWEAGEIEIRNGSKAELELPLGVVTYEPDHILISMGFNVLARYFAIRLFS